MRTLCILKENFESSLCIKETCFRGRDFKQHLPSNANLKLVTAFQTNYWMKKNYKTLLHQFGRKREKSPQKQVSMYYDHRVLSELGANEELMIFWRCLSYKQAYNITEIASEDRFWLSHRFRTPSDDISKNPESHTSIK